MFELHKKVNVAKKFEGRESSEDTRGPSLASDVAERLFGLLQNGSRIESATQER